MKVSTRTVVVIAAALLLLNALSAAYLLVLVHFVSVQGANLASATKQSSHIAQEFAQVAHQLAGKG